MSINANGDVPEIRENTQENFTESKATEETPEQINWKQFREKQKELRKQQESFKKAQEEAERIAKNKEQEAKILKETLEALLSKNESENVQEETQEAVIEKKIQDALERAERKRIEEAKKRELEELPERIESSFPDAKEVLSEENIDYFKYHHPEIASTWAQVPESLQKYENLYKTIKKLVPNASKKGSFSTAERNMMKPQSASATGMASNDKPRSAFLSDEQKLENWKRMQQALKDAR